MVSMQRKGEDMSEKSCKTCAIKPGCPLHNMGMTNINIDNCGIYVPKDPENIICPFCGEDGFDKIGLKYHLASGDCAEFEDVEEV